MKARKNEAAPKPKKPARNPPVKKDGKIGNAPEPEKPLANPPMPEEMIQKIAGCFENMESMLRDHAVSLKALDRRRLNGVRKPTLGFVLKAYKYASEDPQLLPHYCPIGKFSEDLNYFENFQRLLNLSDTVREFLWNITLMAAHTAYDDALTFYARSREAASKGKDAQENAYNDLSQFFKKTKKAGAAPTQKEATRDFKAVLRGKRDGEVTARNVKPKVLKGKHEVIDEAGE